MVRTPKPWQQDILVLIILILVRLRDTEMLTIFWTNCVILKCNGDKTIQQICDIIKPHIRLAGIYLYSVDINNKAKGGKLPVIIVNFLAKATVLGYSHRCIPRMGSILPCCLPGGKAGGLQILRCQGIVVAYYKFTLDAWTLKPSEFCNVGV
jgi:hypothetical protein